MERDTYETHDWGTYVREERKKLKWTQQDLATRLRISSVTVTRWERGLALAHPQMQQSVMKLFAGEEEDGGTYSIPLPEIYDSVAIPDLPIPETGLIGREQLVHGLTLMFHTHSGSFALWGMYGAGKTALAVTLAHDRSLWTHFSAGILWAGLGRNPSCIDILSRWGTQLGLAAGERTRLTTLPEWQQAIRHAIGMRRMLIIIDDAWNPMDALNLHCGGIHCVYLLTTRSQEVAHAFTRKMEHVFPVEELPEKESLRLLEILSPELAEMQSEQDEMKTLIRLLGGLPLALTIVGQHLHLQGVKGQPRRVRTAIEQLKQAESRLRMILLQRPSERPANLAGDVSLSLYTAIEVSDLYLPERARYALHALSVFPAKPQSFSEEAALQIGTLTEKELDALVDAKLLESPGQERYTMHQTIADYARLRFQEKIVVHSPESIEERMVQYFVTFIEQHIADHNLLEREIPNIVEALSLSIKRDMLTLSMQGINALVPCLETKGIYGVIESCCQIIRERASALNKADLLARACFHLGRIAQVGQDFGQAEQYYEEGVQVARQIGERQLLAAFQTYWGEIIVHGGDHLRGEKYVQEALTITQELGGEPRRMGLLLRLLGEIESSRGNAAAAIELFERGLKSVRQVKDSEAMSTLLQDLGVCAERSGNYEQAEQYYQEGKAYAQKVGYRPRISAILMNQGMLAFKQKKYPRARRLYQESLERIQNIQAPMRKSSVLQNLGMLERILGNYTEAAVYLQQSLDIAYQIEHTWLISETLYEWGEFYLAQEMLAEATVAFEKALQIAQEIEGKELIASAEYGLARVAQRDEELVRARQWGEQSLEHFQETGNETINLVEEWLKTLPEASS